MFHIGSREFGGVVFLFSFFPPLEAGEKQGRRKQYTQVLAIMLHKFLGTAVY